MRRTLLPLLLALAGVTACETTDTATSISPAAMATRPAELNALDRMVGAWTSTSRIVSVTGEMAANMPPTTGSELPTATGMGTWSWTLGGRFLKADGWHTEGDKRVHSVEYMTWDPGEKKFHSFYFSDGGDVGEGWATLEGNTMRGMWRGTKPDGSVMEGVTELLFVDEDTMTWTWVEESDAGRVEVSGTNKRL